MTEDKKNTHGGAREGSGRKKKEPTQVIAFRVKKKHAKEAKAIVKPIIDKINKK